MLSLAPLRTALIAACLMVVALPAHSSHYYLADIEVLDPALQQHFVERGMTHSREILLALQETEARQLLARSTSFDEATLLEAAIQLELIQIEGIGPRAARLLRAAGIEGAIDLASRDATVLLPELERVNDGFVHTSVHPSLHHVQGWVHATSAAEIIVAR